MTRSVEGGQPMIVSTIWVALVAEIGTPARSTMVPSLRVLVGAQEYGVPQRA